MTRPAITTIYEPKPDINLYELALILPRVTGRGFLALSEIAEMPTDVRRHFKVLYDSTDAEAVEWVRRYEAGESLDYRDASPTR